MWAKFSFLLGTTLWLNHKHSLSFRTEALDKQVSLLLLYFKYIQQAATNVHLRLNDWVPVDTKV